MVLLLSSEWIISFAESFALKESKPILESDKYFIKLLNTLELHIQDYTISSKTNINLYEASFKSDGEFLRLLSSSLQGEIPTSIRDKKHTMTSEWLC